MVETKMNVTLVLLGSTRVSPQSIRKQTKNKKSHNKEVVKKTFTARQVIKLSKEAYKNILNWPTDSKYNRIVAKSKGKPIRVWDTMSEDARIKKHCEIIAHDMGAISFDYIVFGD